MKLPTTETVMKGSIYRRASFKPIFSINIVSIVFPGFPNGAGLRFSYFTGKLFSSSSSFSFTFKLVGFQKSYSLVVFV